MTDRRLHPGNGRVVLEGWEPQGGEVPVPGRSGRSLRDDWILESPDGKRERQILFGDQITIIEEVETHAFVWSERGPYVGWIASPPIVEDLTPTHFVSVRTTRVYPTPNLKVPPINPFDLHMTSDVRVTETCRTWSRIDVPHISCWVHSAHLSALGKWLDVVPAARAFLGSHYTWAGNSGYGLDCSGLVSSAYRAAGYEVPGDSDLQEQMPGTRLSEGDPLAPGDLIFWKGHVAIATGPDSIIHSNAHHMMVVEEPLSEAITRIAATDTGPVTSRLRPDPPHRALPLVKSTPG